MAGVSSVTLYQPAGFAATHYISMAAGSVGAGDVMVLAFVSHRSPSRTVTAVSGGGATWAQAYAPGGRVEYWIGTGGSFPSVSSIQVDLSGSSFAQAAVFVVTGLSSTTTAGAHDSATGTSLTGTAQTAGSGQVVISTGSTAASSGATWPASSSPATGWTDQAAYAASSFTSGFAHRVPSSSGSHAKGVASSSSVNLQVTQLVIGTAGASSTTGAVAAVAPAATSAASGVVTTPAAIAASAPAAVASAAGVVTVEGAIAATAPAAVAAAEGTSDDTTSGIITATAPAATASAAGTATTDGQITATAPAASVAATGDVTIPDGTAGAVAATAPGAVASLNAGVQADPIATARVHTPSGIRAIIPLVAATPPDGLTPIPIERVSHVMAPLTAAHPDHDPHQCAAGDTTIVRDTIGHVQLWIGGRNVTFWRDVLVDIGRWESEVPFGDTVAAFEFPQLNPWDKPGDGDADWLYPDAPVAIGVVDPEGGVRRVWSGFYDANGVGMAEDEDYPWEAKGTLWAAMHDIHEPRPFTEPLDIWVLVARTLNSVRSRRWARIPETPIGITTLNRGSRDQFKWEYVQELMTEAVTDDGRQWTISEPLPGIFRPVLKPAPSTVHATVAVGTPGVDIDLRIDESTRVDLIYGRGVGKNGGGWANVYYPGLELLIPPPYPNNDASTITIGDSDATTDSGDGVTVFQQRMNELRAYGTLAVDGTFDARDAAVLAEAQAALGILVDGILGPQSWNRIFNRSGEGINLDPFRRPLAVKPWVEARLYDAAGVDVGPNPNYDPQPVPRAIAVDFGAMKTKSDGRRMSRAMLAKYGTAAAAGTIRFELDPNETDRTRISHLSNIKVRGHQGVDRVLQVASKSVELETGDGDTRQYVVTVRVDEHARDAMAVEDLLEQRRSAIPDPSRRPGSPNRSSRNVNDQRIPWDSESPCGVVRRTAINGAAGLPSVIPVPFAEVGKLAGIELHATQPFAFMICASLRITENKAQAIVGDPFASSDPFRPHYDALAEYGIIEAWGEQGNACGYSPLTEGDGGSFTGLFKLDTPVDYVTETVPIVSVVVWMRGASGFIWGNFIPAYEG